jgi:hypothetical protein
VTRRTTIARVSCSECGAKEYRNPHVTFVPPGKTYCFDCAEHVQWGRCRSGRRWFWAATLLGGDYVTLHGWADSECQAAADAQAAVLRLADGRPTSVGMFHNVASSKLKEINAARRRERPASGGESAAPVEYLYGTDHGEHTDFKEVVVSFPITRKTAKRVYYVRSRRGRDVGDVEIGYVDRQELESKGEVRRKSGGWWEDDFHLYAEPPDVGSRRPAGPDLAELKAAMAAAHPDRGGTDEAFIAARRRFVAARRLVTVGRAS